MKKSGSIIFRCLCLTCLYGTANGQGSLSPWRATLQRSDGKQIVFQLQPERSKDKTVWYIRNGEERIPVRMQRTTSDSLYFTLPAFEVTFRVRKSGDTLRGEMIKGTSTRDQVWPFLAISNRHDRFSLTGGPAKRNISGKWDVTITRPNGTIRKALAIFEQQGDHLTGTLLTPSADYRYLEGVVTGDSLKLSSFDGDNIRLFEAQVAGDSSLVGGYFYNGFVSKETWTARRTDSMPPPEAIDPTRMKPGQSTLDFRFPDLNGRMVSIHDPQYKNKVVLVQILGSWCANCLDETRFLVDYYGKNHARGFEIIGLAYELTTDPKRSKASVEKMKQLLQIPYLILLTGASSGDEQKTEKTLPQLTPIRSFPTSIFIDRRGVVRAIHTNFYGPGAGEYYEQSKKEVEEQVEELLKE